MRFFDPQMDEVVNLVTAINEKVTELSEGQIENAIDADHLLLKVALLYDSIMLYTSAISTLGLTDGSNITCDSEESWNYGSTIINHIRTVSTFQCVNYFFLIYFKVHSVVNT